MPRFRFAVLAVGFWLLPSVLQGQTPEKTRVNLVHALPPHTPAWLEPYQVRWPVRVLGDLYKQSGKTVLVRIPTGGWLKPDASDLAVQTASGKTIPFALLSHDPLGDTIVQFARSGDDPWYWIYGVAPGASALVKADPKTLREGITLEIRDWEGDDLTSWAIVRKGLERSVQVIGNAVVADPWQNCNPARPSQSNKFAASYRGFLDIKKEGTYRFLVNADDASFLFIDGFKVAERTGINRTLGTVKLKDLEKLAGKVDLKPGIHEFEVHQAVSSRPDANGVCALMWSPPGEAKFTFLPPSAVAQPLYARAAAVEKKEGECAGPFTFGMEDTVETLGLRLLLVRLEAHGPGEDGSFVWNFGDGTTGTGRSVVHVYFKEGDYTVTLKSPNGLSEYKRRVHVWAEPWETGPLSLPLAVEALNGMEWKKLGVQHIREIFSFLQVCQQPTRWALLDQVAQHLLTQKDLDLEFRSQLFLARLEALTELGKAADALKLAEEVKGEFMRTPALQVRIQLGVAAIHQYHFKDATAASKIYKAILDEHSRVEHPNLRLAGVRWGDLFAEAGDLVKASETYRVAATLGGEKFNSTATTEASTRGALLRIAEQKLRGGDVLATRQLLEKLEIDYPGRRLDGLYCYLKAESDRFAGRYEEALRNYEMIFKLPAWAGYRDRASFGIADCYLRMGQIDKTLKWFGEIKEAFPKFYEEKKVAETEKLVQERQKRLHEAKAKGEKEAPFFTMFGTGFEPGEPVWFGDTKDTPVVRVFGIHGPHALLLGVFPAELGGVIEYQRPLKDLTPGTLYWVDVWYRDLVRPSPPATHQQAMMNVTFTGDPDSKAVASHAVALPRTSHHHWHRCRLKLRAPMAQDVQMKLTFTNQTGFMLIDRVVVRPVADGQLDAMLLFQEGGKAP